MLTLIAPEHIKGFTALKTHFHMNRPFRIQGDTKLVRKISLKRGTHVTLVAKLGMTSYPISKKRNHMSTTEQRSVELVV
jgi:hypothetical protein